jgi:hypothetical protein
MIQVYFTFKTFSDAGIGDQLGAQFAHVFALGSLCGWTYVHLSPIGFNRRNFGSWFSKADDMSSQHNVSSLLGLNLTSVPPLVDKKIVVNLSSLISDARCKSQVNDRLLEILNKPKTNTLSRQESESSVLLEIELDENYHALIPTIEALVEMSWTQVLQFSGEAFLQRQCSSISSTSPFSHPCAVAHVRIGDSIRINTPFCPIILHGREVYTNLSEYRRIIGSVDPGRQPHFNPFDLADRMDSLLFAKGFKRESLFIVSDGFKTTKACILAHMRSRRLNLRMAISALRSIDRLESMLFRVIRDIPPSRRIIGEDSDSTLKSIKLFSSADFLMCNSGGFSNVIFNLYNPMAQADDAFAWL